MGKKEFFEQMKALGLALTYNDVRLKTSYSSVMPDSANIESRFSKNIPLKMPIVSAAMDTVTESELAIEMAKLGSLGIIHKNMSPADQAKQVSRVKRHLNGLIDSPLLVYDDQTMQEVLEMREKLNLSFHTFPVINRQGKLVGILTENDFDFCSNYSLHVQEVMSNQLLTAPENTSVAEAYKLMLSRKKKVLPLVDFQGFLKGMYIFSDVKRIITGSSSSYNVDARGQLRVGAAIGVKNDALERTKALVQENIDVVVIDTAHGDSLAVLETLKEIKSLYPNLDVVAGNVSEPESALRLIQAGADGIKIGQGPGSICTTRIIAGIGCPQVTAVYNCSQIAQQYNVPICADGGLSYSGDIPIAIGVGADCVMMGRMLAGTKEAPGDLVFRDGRQWKSYRGMGSIGAMQEHKGSRDRYNQRDASKDSMIPEGVEGLVPYQGELKEVIKQYIGGLKRGMGYVGAGSIPELKEKSDLHRISPAGQAESHPHNIFITKESPNYPGSV
ncbi:MAG: IMP dehydrogenase [Nanoarchaeota archaeon]|nr:IMP dehydrogenase [Nanoarchaeota archaeon]